MGGATWRPGNVSACQERCALDPTANDTKPHLLRCRYMCGSTGASDCGPDTLNKSAGWGGTCENAFVDEKWHCANWPHFVRLLNATISAVRDASPETKVMVHISDWGKAVWWLQQAQSLSLAPFDLLGVSYYQLWMTSYTSGGPINTLRCKCSWCLSQVQQLWPELPIVIVETTYPFEPYENQFHFNETNADFPFTLQGQHDYLAQLIHVAKTTFGVGGRPTGVYWWCPECADSCERQSISCLLPLGVHELDLPSSFAFADWKNFSGSCECSSHPRSCCRLRLTKPKSVVRCRLPLRALPSRHGRGQPRAEGVV